MTKGLYSVLIVDDQESWCETIAAILEDAGLSVRFARTYDQAVVELNSQNFNLVIIDIRLQEEVDYNVEGIDLLQLIHERKQGLPAIILTGHGTPALQQKAEWYDAYAFLEKLDDKTRFDRDLFLTTVKEAIGADNIS